MLSRIELRQEMLDVGVKHSSGLFWRNFLYFFFLAIFAIIIFLCIFLLFSNVIHCFILFAVVVLTTPLLTLNFNERNGIQCESPSQQVKLCGIAVQEANKN